MSKKPILYVIDDDKYFILGVSKGLRIEEYCSEVLFFDDPEDALDAIENSFSSNFKVPEILFLDIQMPRIDGWEFLKALKEKIGENQSLIRIFIVSSSVMDSDMAKAMSFPQVENYLTKPLTRDMMDSVFGLN